MFELGPETCLGPGSPGFGELDELDEGRPLDLMSLLDMAFELLDGLDAEDDEEGLDEEEEEEEDG